MAELGNVVILIAGEVEPAWEEDFHRWYNQEHLAQRIVLPGFLGARRYVNSGDFAGPTHLTINELESDAVLQSGAYLEMGRHPTAWTRRVREHAKLTRGVYRRIFSIRGPGPLLGQALSVVWADVQPGWEQEFHHWYDREHLPERMEVGYLGARRFERVEGTGQQYLVVYELPDERIIHTPAYRELMANPSEWTRRMQGHMQLKRAVYRQVFPAQRGLFTRAILNAWQPPEGLTAPSPQSALVGRRGRGQGGARGRKLSTGAMDSLAQM
ncbi:MAG: hypothetical protein HY535_03180 [Chloroflexi bacterium]|nr:hypothetical protein [Chloroflexota bacterium]